MPEQTVTTVDTLTLRDLVFPERVQPSKREEKWNLYLGMVLREARDGYEEGRLLRSRTARLVE